MSDGNVVISVESLSKRYFIGHQSRTDSGYDCFRDSVVRSARHIGRRAVNLARGRLVVAGGNVEDFRSSEVRFSALLAATAPANRLY